MEKSDSENDSDCYESAEEEFEKNETLEEVPIEKLTSFKNVSESESDVFKSVNSFRVAENNAPRKEASKNTVSYRKRPERVRRLNSITSSKKEPHKMEINTPDAFLQDLTMNFSKNLNKSLNTIQQTSSSVKDMIINSLPVTTLGEKSAFSYDDNDNLAMDFDTNSELYNSSQSELISNELSKCLAEDRSEDRRNIKKSLEDEINNLSKNFELNTKVQENNSDKPTINMSMSDCKENLKDAINDGKNNKSVETSKNKKHENESHAPFTEFDLESIESKSDILKMDIKDDKHQNEEDEFLKETSSQIVKIIECKDYDLNEDEFGQASTNSVQLSKEHETISDAQNPSTSEILTEQESIRHNTEIKTSISEYESDDWNDNLQFTNSTEGVDSWIKGDWDDFTEEPIEDKTEHSECDLEALKTSLEKIVLQNESGNQNEIEPYKDEFRKSEKISNFESTEATQDGWDDFDFSDHELENVDVESNEAKNLKENDKLPKDQKKDHKKVSRQDEEKFVKENIKKEKSDKEVERKFQTKPKRNVLGAKKLEKATTEKVSKPGVKENKPVDNDNWDWDSWDDGAQKKTEKKEPSRKEGVKRNNFEINEFEEKWSGWDKFAQKEDEKEGNWNLGSWGMNMLINKATAVTQGISTVLEAGLGAPDPETLARMEKEEKVMRSEGNSRQLEESGRKNSNDAVMFPVFELTNLVAGVTSKIVDPSKIQEIGSKVISGGLDTLESFGKKTMEVLQEGDPGLKKKRALLLGSNKPVLSQVLREAKEKAEKEDRRMEEKELFRKCQFETLFDDYQGMIHLEALEMLSTQCELKLDQIRSSLNPAEQEDMDGILQEVEQLCCLEDFYLDWDNFSNVDFRVSIELAVESLLGEISLAKILQIHEDVDQWLVDAAISKPSGVFIHQKAVSTLAELTAATVHQFHKTGELLSVKECRKTVEEVDALLKMTNVLCAELERLCRKFIDLCETTSEKDSIHNKIDTVLKNAVSYIKQAFHLLVPIMQVGAAV